MALSTSICGSLQTPVITSRPVRSRTCTSGRLQLVSIQQRGLTTADQSCTSTWRTGGTLLGVAESLRWETRSSTCIHAQSGSSPAEERGSLVVGHNDWRGLHAIAAGTAAAAPTNSASTTAAASSIDDVPATSRKPSSATVGRMEHDANVGVRKPAPAIVGRMELDDLKLIRKVRWLLFYGTTFVLAAFCFSVMMTIHPWVLTFDKQRRVFHHISTKTWATVSTKLFYKTEIVGLENLPAADAGAVVFVANHQSFLDIYLLYHIGRQFRFVSKAENFQIPFIGGLMQLNNYIPMDRTSTMDQLLCLKKCREFVREGISVVLFPEGTRAKDGALSDFKKGAFSVAAKEGVPVVPITLIGTGNLIPKHLDSNLEYMLRTGIIKMVVHPPLHSKNANELREKSRKVIAETLIKHGLPVQENNTDNLISTPQGERIKKTLHNIQWH